VTSLNIHGLTHFTQILQYRIAPHLGRLAGEMKRHNDRQAALQNAPRYSEPHEVFEGHEVRVGRDMFEQLLCPKEECSHHFLVKMEDLDAGAADWVWCPLCKTRVPLHMDDDDAT